MLTVLLAFVANHTSDDSITGGVLSTLCQSDGVAIAQTFTHAVTSLVACDATEKCIASSA